MEKFTAVFERDGEWWMAYIEEIPRAHTQGRTIEEARENLKEALHLYLESQRELSRMQTAGRDVLREELAV